jgi:hypothetical protein
MSQRKNHTFFFVFTSNLKYCDTLTLEKKRKKTVRKEKKITIYSGVISRSLAVWFSLGWAQFLLLFQMKRSLEGESMGSR